MSINYRYTDGYMDIEGHSEISELKIMTYGSAAFRFVLRQGSDTMQIQIQELHRVKHAAQNRSWRQVLQTAH